MLKLSLAFFFFFSFPFFPIFFVAKCSILKSVCPRARTSVSKPTFLGVALSRCDENFSFGFGRPWIPKALLIVLAVDYPPISSANMPSS